MVPVVGRLLSLKRPVFRGYVSFREGIFRAFDVRLRKCRSNGSQRSKKMTHLPIGDAWWCFNTCKLDIAVIATRDQQFWVINTSSFNLFYWRDIYRIKSVVQILFTRLSSSDSAYVWCRIFLKDHSNYATSQAPLATKTSGPKRFWTAPATAPTRIG